MDRQIIYPGVIPLETDLLNAQKNSMIGLSKLATAILGTNTFMNGLACAPDSPASLNVSVAAGEIYSLQNIDGTAYSSLAADTTHQIVKQGIRLDSGLLSCPAPAIAGQSVNYLIQVAYQDTDANAVVLPYYNASNPAQAYSGPNNSGTAQNTVRKGVCAVAVKAGIAATTGSQTTPAPDAGYVGAWVVTVANGQTTITAPNISAYAGAPFLPADGFVAGGFQKQAFTAFTTAGTAPNFTLTPSPAIAAYAAGHRFRVKFHAAGAGADQLNISGLGNKALKQYDSAGAKVAAIIAANQLADVEYDGVDMVILAPLPGDASTARKGMVQLATTTEAQALTDALKALTPATLAGAFGGANGGALSGYQKFPGGLIIQWGSATFADFAATTNVTITFPITFPTGIIDIVDAIGLTGGFAGSAAVNESTITASGFTAVVMEWSSVTQTGGRYRWLAIGY